MTVANVDPDAPRTVTFLVTDRKITSAEGRILTGAMSQYNDFDNAPLHVEPLTGITLDGQVSVTLPACSVAEITLS